MNHALNESLSVESIQNADIANAKTDITRVAILGISLKF